MTCYKAEASFSCRVRPPEKLPIRPDRHEAPEPWSVGLLGVPQSLGPEQTAEQRSEPLQALL